MKKFLLALCILVGVASAECAFDESIDKMEDKKEYIFACLTNGHTLFYFSKQPKPKPKHGRFYINPNKKGDLYSGMFAIKSVNDYGESIQTIRVRIDKNKPFSAEAIIIDNAGAATISLKEKQQEQFLSADKIIIEYETFKNTKKQIEIDVSELKNFDFKVGSTIRASGVVIACEDREDLLKIEEASKKNTNKQPTKKNKECTFFSEYTDSGELKILEIDKNYMKLFPLEKRFENKAYWININDLNY